MIALIVCWAIIAVVALPIGHTLLLAFGGRPTMRTGDWVLLALWLGLIACEWLAAVTALFTAVTPATFGLVAGLTLAVAWTAIRHTPGAFAPFSELLKEARDPQIAALVAIVLAAACVAANLRPTPDTGFYHFPAIRWFAEYGAVTGVVHVNDRFGFISSLWALLAPFDTVLGGRAGGCINGFVLCLVSGQLMLAATRLLRGDAVPSDVFLAVVSFCLLMIGLVIGSFSTPSPDPTVAGLTVVIAWRLLAVYERETGEAKLLPLLLACGALNAKLSGLLLIPVAGLYAVWGAGARRWIIAALVGVVAVAPFFAASVIISGCLAFPASISCLPVSWALPKEAVDELGRLLTLFTRWDSRPPPNPGSWNWIPGWLTAARFSLNTVVFWPFAVSLCGFLWMARRGITRGEGWVLTLIAPNLVLVFLVAPEIRYNAGLFVIPIALFAMRATTVPQVKLSEAGAVMAVVAAIVLVEVGFSFAIELRRSGYVDVAGRLLWPRGAPTAAVTPVSAANLRYNLATSGDCWRASLPCAPANFAPVTLRAPERGLDGGFQSAR